MKNFFLLFALLTMSVLFSQVKQEIKSPSEGKSLVYIVRTGAGALINFRFYDGDKYLETLTSTQYLIYECEPGEHLFWVATENRDYVEANLEADKVYVIIAEGKMGVLSAAASLDPMDVSNKKHKKIFYRVIKNDTPVVYDIKNTIDIDKSKNIKKGLEKYQSLKDSKKVKKLTKEMNVENADRP